MKRRLVSILAVALVVTGLSAQARPGLPGAFDRALLSPHANGRAMVVFTHNVDASTIARLAKAGIVQAVVVKSINAAGVIGSLDAYKTISTWSDVRFVAADKRVRFLNYGAKKDTHVVPQVRGGSKPLKRGYTGKGVTVAVIDTGINSVHPDLTDRVVKNVNFEPAWFFDMIQDGLYSDRLTEGTGTMIDTYGHGTHVAGIVAGTGKQGKTQDFSGVAPEAMLVNIKIADLWEGVDCTVPCDLGWEINALVAYEWVIEHAHDPLFPGGIRVATNSWSIDEVNSDAEPITLIVQAAYRHGIVNVFAAGNDGPGDNTVAKGPNSTEESITVGATCKTFMYETTSTCAAGQVANFSSRGPQVDVSAPGVDIWSALNWTSFDGPTGVGTPPPGTSDPQGLANNAAFYTSFSGTSMATPHVAGIVALMIEANPKLTPAQVEKILITTATDKGAKGFDTSYGFGFVDAFRAVTAAVAPATKKR